MKISLNEIKKLVPAAASVETDELIKLIGSRLVEVEGKLNLAEKYKGIYIVKVVECEPIPDTHLHLCKIDAGAHSLDGPIQVVCGAPNVRKDMLAVWLAPGAVVPETYGEENFKLDVRKLRGYESNGMLAGLDEIDLGDDHSGIIEISPHHKYTDAEGKEHEVSPGDAFAEAFDLNDIILDIENKSLTHRPDTFGLVGFAREVAGILGVKFEYKNEPFDADSQDARLEDTVSSGSPQIVQKTATHSEDSPITVTIKDISLCPRYSCAVIELSDALSDDKYLTDMDVFLAKAGMRGISKIVDITNYMMLMTGQPLHAFDYDKFLKIAGSSEIIIRAAKNGEELQLLDGKTIKCTTDDILITANDIPVALAGAMGGASTEIDASTKRILLESATFSLYNLRKTQMAHGIFSEAITRFTKGQPASQTLPVLRKTISLLGGKLLSVVDEYPSPTKKNVVKITTPEINSLLGTDYKTELIIKTLENVGFTVSCDHEELTVTAPSWRTDIHIKVDIIEEVGRMLGYDNIPLDFPTRPFVGATKDSLLDLKSRLRTILSDKLSAHELLTYSFVSSKLQENVGEDTDDSYEIVNSISPELQRFRQSLIPSLLDKAYTNIRAGYHDFSLYEINQVAKKSYGKDSDNVPILHNHLGFITLGDYYSMKVILTTLLCDLGIKSPVITELKAGSLPYLEPLHSALLTVGSSDSPLKIEFGEIKSTVRKRLKLPETVSAFEIDLDALLSNIPDVSASMPELSKFPSVERDLTVKIAKGATYANVSAAISAALDSEKDKGIIYQITPVSIYQKDDASKTKNLSFHLEFASRKKTLENDEIFAIMNTVSKNIEQVGAEIV
ncbi:phenylalanine--tRNA ligase subunit beta [Candidatus Saccharibacteria bacterium]|nr:phenylalanine--tRNA ligase subunit beta [Candidatus Saccharibacteria bacterium]